MLNTRTTTDTIKDIRLNKYETWDLEGDRRGDVISCSNGTLWITQENDMKDYVIESGQSFWVTRRGAVVVQALQNSNFNYSLNELDSHIEVNRQPIRRLSNHLR